MIRHEGLAVAPGACDLVVEACALDVGLERDEIVRPREHRHGEAGIFLERPVDHRLVIAGDEARACSALDDMRREMGLEELARRVLVGRRSERGGGFANTLRGCVLRLAAGSEVSAERGGVIVLSPAGNGIEADRHEFDRLVVHGMFRRPQPPPAEKRRRGSAENERGDARMRRQARRQFAASVATSFQFGFLELISRANVQMSVTSRTFLASPSTTSPSASRVTVIISLTNFTVT